MRYGDPLLLLPEHRCLNAWEGRMVFSHSLVHRKLKTEVACGRTTTTLIELATGRLPFTDGNIPYHHVHTPAPDAREVNPDVITLALDPEASGPDTHYKVLQATSEALHLYEEETGRSGITVLGYRNVWYRFHPAEADLFVPVSLNMFALQQSAFLHTFISQKDASFPSYEHDGTTKLTR